MAIKLSKQGKKAESLIKRGIKQGLNTSEIQQLLKKHGLSYRRQTMLKDIRILRGVAKHTPVKRKAPIKIFFEEDCCPSDGLITTMMEIWGCDEDKFFDVYFEWLKQNCKAVRRGDEPPSFPYEA